MRLNQTANAVPSWPGSGGHTHGNSDKFGFVVGFGYPGKGTNLGIRQLAGCERLSDNRQFCELVSYTDPFPGRAGFHIRYICYIG